MRAGLLQAEKAERERLERWQGEMEKQTLRAPASLTPAPVASSGNVAPFPSSGLNSLPPEAVSLAAELACSRHTSTETRDGSTGVGEGSQGNDVTASMGDVRAEEWVVLGIGVDAEKKGPSAESSEREAGDLVRERRAVVHEPGCSEVDGGDGAGLEPGSSAADEQRLVEGEPGGSKLEAEYSVARELGKSEADRQRRMEKVVGSPKADGRRPVEGEPGSSEERRLGELLEVVERQDEELSKVREELNKVQEELRLRDEGGREGLEVQGEVRLQEGRTASGGERQTESGTERGAVSGTERGRENGTERRAAPRLRGDGATRGAERERSWPEMEGTERELNVIDKSCGTDLEGGLEEVGATGGAATERERTSGTAERWNGTNGAGVTVSNMGGHLDGSAAKGTSRASRTKGLGPEWDPQALEGLLAELESQQNVQCTMSFLLTLIRSCKALLAGEGRSDANGVGHRGEAKRVAGKAGKHQALLKVLEGAREQRWAAEAALRGLHVSAGAVEASTQGRILAQELSGTGPQGRNGFVQSKESHVAVVRLLTATMTEVARDVSVQTTGLADASTSEGLDGVLSASGDASGAKVGRSGEGLGGLPSGLSKNYGGVTGTGLYGVLDNVRKRAVGAETARELRKEVSDLCGVVGLEGEAGTTAVTRLLEATDAVIGCFYSSHGSGRNLGSQRNGERASETCLRSGEKLRGKTGVAAERQSELAMELTVRTELEELQELLDKLRREGDSLRRQSEEICAQASRAKQKAEREALEVQERAGKAKEKWEREALEREGEKGRAEKELQGLKGEVWKTEAELWKVKGEVLRVREELGSVEKELRRVVEERNVTVGETESLRKRVLSLKEDVKSAENEVESERERARESRKEALAAAEEAGKSREKLRALEELVQKATQTVDHLESDRKVLLERLRGTESALRRGEEEVLRVRQTVDETEGKLRELEDKERDMRGRMEGGRRDVDQLEQRVAEVSSVGSRPVSVRFAQTSKKPGSGVLFWHLASNPVTNPRKKTPMPSRLLNPSRRSDHVFAYENET